MKRELLLLFILYLAACVEAWPQEVSPGTSGLAVKPKPEMTLADAPLRFVSLRFWQDIRSSNAQILYTPQGQTPGVSCKMPQRSIASWPGGAIYGGSEDVSMSGLMRRQGVAFNAIERQGDFTFSIGLAADRYAFPSDRRLDAMGMNARQNQLAVSGMVTYDFSGRLSATIYGRYASDQFYYSMAAFPYIGTSQYGGFFTLRGESAGIDLGVNNCYDPFARRWQTDPIVRPKFKIGKVEMDVDLGPLMKDAILRIAGKQRRQGPIIMPGR